MVRLARGERLTVTGLGIDEVRQALTTVEAQRPALILPQGGGSTEAILQELIDDLAELALTCWPRWYGRDCSTADGLHILPQDQPDVSAPWFRAAARRAATGYRPRFRRTARSIEFTQLMQAIGPPDLVLLAPADPVDARRAAPVIQVLEWCAGQGASVVALFPSRPAPVPPFERLLYDAVEAVPTAEPLQLRFIAPSGRAHHASLVEQRVEAALRHDCELAPLFACNQTVAIDGYGNPRVDLLWREGRVVVELDGPEHQGDPNFANDRHRDYELLMAGYLVLRITNHQVTTDLQAAVEKIRAVVRFRQSTTSMR
ncbi:endonuclease domain-containing protein [Rhodopseudomonas sp. NSM]|uniref:endonuclease domain-containing protein n=1 Tax=Rhodopseudomonas sp. NSM TaxID=3457630 RepID=UPI0040353EA1